MKKKQHAKSGFNAKAPRPTGLVTDYADAAPKVKKSMEQVMEAIDKAPDSFEAVISYGAPAMEKLAKIMNGAGELQSKVSDKVDGFADTLRGVETNLKGMNLDAFGDAAQKLHKASAQGLEDLKSARIVGKGLASLPKMHKKVDKMADSVAKSGKGLKKTLKKVGELNDSRALAVEEISLHIGAAKEVLRRYNEVYIPEAAARFKASLGPEDELYLQTVMKRKDDFIERITTIEGARVMGAVVGQQLQQMAELVEDKRKQAQSILDNSQHEFKAMINAAALAGSTLGVKKQKPPRNGR
ncbi:MAG: toxic anion resistance protein [Alphaproteobacteria bacterium]